jgi:hypothetical protein
VLVDIVSDLAGVELDVIRNGGQLESVRSAWVEGCRGRGACIRRLGIQSHRQTSWVGERGESRW